LLPLIAVAWLATLLVGYWRWRLVINIYTIVTPLLLVVIALRQILLLVATPLLFVHIVGFRHHYVSSSIRYHITSLPFSHFLVCATTVETYHNTLVHTSELLKPLPLPLIRHWLATADAGCWRSLLLSLFGY